MKTLSIIIPIFNESARIQGCLDALTTWKTPKGISIERVIFVDDGSDDNSKLIIKNSKSTLEKNLRAKITIISYSQNRGKGYAVKVGMQASTSDYTLFVDVDMATPLSELTKFLPAMKQNIDVIVGTRKNGKSTVIVHQPKYRELMGKGFTFLSNVILNTWVTDFTCGFKAFSRDAKNHIFPHLSCERWSFDAEAIFLARRMDFSIAEVAVTWTDKHGSKVNIMMDTPRSFAELISIRFSHAMKMNTSIGAKYRLLTAHIPLL